MLNLQNPWQGRRWLKLLVEDNRCGYRLRPNLDVPASELGFSLKSNSLGLRGPDDPAADTVVFGTSFAMGIAVNNGENWHELCLPRRGWLNLGLAVGIRQWGELVAMLHRGPARRAIILYHPNLWMHCLMYERWLSAGTGVFTALRWRTDWLGCVGLTWRRFCSRQRARSTGGLLDVQMDGDEFEIDARYARLDRADEEGVFARNIGMLQNLAAPFAEVSLVRLPVRQEMVPPGDQNGVLVETVQQYDRLWQRTVAALIDSRAIRVETPGGFELRHFHQCDSHWNAAGNRHFAHWFARAIVGDDGSRSPVQA